MVLGEKDSHSFNRGIHQGALLPGCRSSSGQHPSLSLRLAKADNDALMGVLSTCPWKVRAQTQHRTKSCAWPWFDGSGQTIAGLMWCDVWGWVPGRDYPVEGTGCCSACTWLSGR